jgi:hypothetical protein
VASLQEDDIVNRDADEARLAVGQMMYQAVGSPVDEIETELLEAGTSTTPGFACDSGVTVPTDATSSVGMPTTSKPGNVRRGNEQV